MRQTFWRLKLSTVRLEAEKMLMFICMRTSTSALINPEQGKFTLNTETPRESALITYTETPRESALITNTETPRESALISLILKHPESPL